MAIRSEVLEMLKRRMGEKEGAYPEMPTPENRGEPEPVEQPEAPEMRNARLEEAAMPADQVMVPEPGRNVANQNKTTEQMRLENYVARGVAPGSFEQSLAAAKEQGLLDKQPADESGGGRVVETRANALPAEMTGRGGPTPIKAKKPNPLAGAFADNQKALLGQAFDENEKALLSEAFSRSQETPEPDQQPADASQEPAPVDPRKQAQVPAERGSSAVPNGATIDKRARMAALQGVVDNAWKMGGQEAPKGGYYQEQIKLGDEQARFGESEKDRRAKAVEQFLAQKFTGEQNQLNRDVQTQHNKATEAQAAAQFAGLEANRKALDEDRDAARTQQAIENQLNRDARHQNVIVQVNAAKDARAEKATTEFEKNLPGPEEEAALSRIQKRIQSDQAPQGWDIGRALDTAGEVPVLGAPFKLAGNAARRGTESEGLLQDAIMGMKAYAYRVSGKAVTDVEKKDIENTLGMAAQQSWGAFRRAWQNQIDAINARSERGFAAQSPLAQQKIQERGIMQPITPADKTGYAPKWEPGFKPENGGSLFFPSPDGPSQELSDWLTKKYGKVPGDFPFKKGIYAKKAMEDPDFRALVRKNEGIN